MEINSKPEELDKLDRRVRQLEIELVAIKREKDKNKVNSINQELRDFKEKRDSLFAQWRKEKMLLIRFNNQNQK